MAIRTALGTLSLSLSFAFAAVSQTSAPKPELLLYHPPAPLSYEVATIKPLDPKTADSMVRLPPGVPNGLSPLSIRRYIMDAYGAIYLAQVVSGPEWLDKDSYRINGKPSAELEAAQHSIKLDDWVNQNHAMEQSLLADRFHLKAHFETRTLPVYELVPAKGGLKITEAAAPPDRHRGDPPPPPPPPPQPGVSAPPLSPGTLMTIYNNSLRTIRASSVKMPALARTISTVGATELEPRPIVDRTGFTGYFDIKDLTFAPLSTSTTDPSDTSSLQRALEEQLGIKLQPTRAPIEVLVIDSIEKPSEN